MSGCENKRALLIGGGGTLGTYTAKELLRLGACVDVVCPEEKTSDNEKLRFFRGMGTEEFLSPLFAETHYDGIVNFIHYPNPDEYKQIHSPPNADVALYPLGLKSFSCNFVGSDNCPYIPCFFENFHP